MADSVLISFIFLAEEYVEYIQTFGVFEQIKDIERELRLMHAYLKHAEGLERMGEREKGLADEMKEIALDAGAAIDTFLLKTAQRKKSQSMYNKFVYLIDATDRILLSKDLTKFMSRIHDLLNKRKIYGFSLRPSHQGGRPQQESTISAMVSQLITTFTNLTQGFNLHRTTRTTVARVAYECKHLLWLLKEMEMVEQDERLKVWMKDIEDIILHANQVIDSFKQLGKRNHFSTRMIPDYRFHRQIRSIEGKIYEALRRKSAYGIGDIGGMRAQSTTVQELRQVCHQDRMLNGLRFWFHNLNHPNNFMGRWLRMWFLPTRAGFAQQRIPSIEFKSVEDEVDSIGRDLRLMNALVKDIETIEDPDGIMNAWVEEVKIVAEDTKNIIDTCIEQTNLMSCGDMILGNSLIKVFNRIRKTIDTLYERRTFYAIKHDREQHGSVPVTEAQPAQSSGSNEDIPLYLLRCLLYFELFPANDEIPARRLIVLWVAEGLVHQKKGDIVLPEDVAEGYLNELIARGMVHIKKKKVNGKVRTCQLSPDDRNMLLSRAKKDMFLPTSESSLSTGVIRRLADHHNENHPSFQHIHGGNNNNINNSASLRKHYRNLLSFLSFDTREGSNPGEEVGNFLHRCITAKSLQLLRVLDLEGVLRLKLPKEVGKLIFMRYLGLRWTHLQTLPSFIHNLLNLQTIDLKQTCISTLPRSIWKMQQLRHLYLTERYRTKFVTRPRGGSLEDLQTLRGLSINEETQVRGGLDTLVSLRKLGLACRYMSSPTDASSSQLNAVAEWVCKLKKLQYLRLTSHNEMHAPGELNLHSLSGLDQLSIAELIGQLSPSVVASFPHSLTELTLSETRLINDPMHALDKLPNLKILRLFSESYVGQTMNCISGGFPQLQVLQIWKLDKLEMWTMEEATLPNLIELEIRACIHLQKLPDGLQHIMSLDKLKLTMMPQEFTDQVKAHREWDKIAHIQD